ncbi:unnamed protein product [Nyctereutes procyonoides]|uniref:(raccoon dog) hypothetical protein n=1 Tax=Nyctereutes procyonoides TaxID=34880 RepID=A0A811Y812_NYCPR|nr:unnamed protein product [Nyctereutes procyonoides]
MAGTLETLWNKYTWAFENGGWWQGKFMSRWKPLRLAGPLAAYNPGLVALSGYLFCEPNLCTADGMILPNTYTPKETCGPLKASRQPYPLWMAHQKICVLIKIERLQARVPLESLSVNTSGSFSFSCANRHLWAGSQSRSPSCKSAMFFNPWDGVRYVPQSFLATLSGMGEGTVGDSQGRVPRWYRRNYERSHLAPHQPQPTIMTSGVSCQTSW